MIVKITSKLSGIKNWPTPVVVWFSLDFNCEITLEISLFSSFFTCFFISDELVSAFSWSFKTVSRVFLLLCIRFEVNKIGKCKLNCFNGSGSWVSVAETSIWSYTKKRENKERWDKMRKMILNYSYRVGKKNALLFSLSNFICCV